MAKTFTSAEQVPSGQMNTGTAIVFNQPNFGDFNYRKAQYLMQQDAIRQQKENETMKAIQEDLKTPENFFVYDTQEVMDGYKELVNFTGGVISNKKDPRDPRNTKEFTEFNKLKSNLNAKVNASLQSKAIVAKAKEEFDKDPSKWDAEQFHSTMKEFLNAGSIDERQAKRTDFLTPKFNSNALIELIPIDQVPDTESKIVQLITRQAATPEGAEIYAAGANKVNPPWKTPQEFIDYNVGIMKPFLKKPTSTGGSGGSGSGKDKAPNMTYEYSLKFGGDSNSGTDRDAEMKKWLAEGTAAAAAGDKSRLKIAERKIQELKSAPNSSGKVEDAPDTLDLFDAPTLLVNADVEVKETDSKGEVTGTRTEKGAVNFLPRAIERNPKTGEIWISGVKVPKSVAGDVLAEGSLPPMSVPYKGNEILFKKAFAGTDLVDIPAVMRRERDNYLGAAAETGYQESLPEVVTTPTVDPVEIDLQEKAMSEVEGIAEAQVINGRYKLTDATGKSVFLDMKSDAPIIKDLISGKKPANSLFLNSKGTPQAVKNPDGSKISKAE